MSKISTVIYKEIENYSIEEASREYLYQNTLDASNVDEYEEYKIYQKHIRDSHLRYVEKCTDPQSCIFAPSTIKKKVVLVCDIR